MAKLTDKDIAAIRQRHAGGEKIKALAREYGIDPSTVRYHIQHTAAPSDGGASLVTVESTGDVRPETMMELYGLDRDKWVPTRFNISIGRHGARGSLSCKRVMTESVEAAILQFVRENIKPLPKPKLTRARKRNGEYLAVLGLWDLHIGLYAWSVETGADWDVNIACTRGMNAIDDVCEELSRYKIDKVVMPAASDFFHYDSARQQTAHGEHHLDCDSRFGRVYLAGLRLMSYVVERAVELCPNVELLYVQGNHDISTGFTLCAALDERYRNDPRVTVDLGAHPRKYRLYGGTLLGFDHGVMPAQRLKTIFSEEAKEFWSASTYRELQVGHKHQGATKDFQGIVPMNGITIRTNPSLCNADFWHTQKGFVGALRTMEAYRYDRIGYRGSHVAWARDDEHSEAKRVIKEIG